LRPTELGATRRGRDGRGDRWGSGRRRGAEEGGGRALADGGWKGAAAVVTGELPETRGVLRVKARAKGRR